MAKSTLSSVVSDLVRASMGNSVPGTITDEDLDRHVAELILKEAKQKAEKYGKEGIQAYLPSGYTDSNAPRTNKRFLSSIIRSTDDHNKTILRAQALAAQEIKQEREEQERRERRVRAEEAVAAERMRRLMRSGHSNSDGWRTKRDRSRHRDRDADRNGKRRREDSRERRHAFQEEDGYSRDDGDSKRTRRHRSPSLSEDPNGKGRSRSRRFHDGYHRAGPSRERESRYKAPKDGPPSDRGDSEDEYRRRGHRHRGSHDDDNFHRKRRFNRSSSPVSGKGKKRAQHHHSDSASLEDDLRESRSDRNSHSHSREFPVMREESRRRSTGHKGNSKGKEKADDVDLTPQSTRKSPSCRPQRSRSSSSSRTTLSRSPSLGPSPPSPSLPSKMDRYFEENYDPRLDVAPLSVPTVPATGLINDAEFAGWDAMLELIRIRREDKLEKKRLERLGLTKDKTSSKKTQIGEAEVADRWSGGGDSIMNIEYKKRGSVREWDLGKEEF